MSDDRVFRDIVSKVYELNSRVFQSSGGQISTRVCFVVCGGGSGGNGAIGAVGGVNKFSVTLWVWSLAKS